MSNKKIEERAVWNDACNCVEFYSKSGEHSFYTNVNRRTEVRLLAPSIKLHERIEVYPIRMRDGKTNDIYGHYIDRKVYTTSSNSIFVFLRESGLRKDSQYRYAKTILTCLFEHIGVSSFELVDVEGTLIVMLPDQESYAHARFFLNEYFV